MIRYILRRLLWVIFLLFAVSFVTFVIFYLLPSADPAVLRAGRQANPELVASIRHQLGLDQPWYVQYGRYMKELIFHFDFGFSYQNGVPVRQLIFSRLPASISLAAGAAVLWLVIGIGVGIIAAVRPRTKLDRASMGAALVGISAPVYWLGLVALYLFSSDIGLIPILPGANSYVPLSEDPFSWFTSLIMPWCVLAVSFAAFYSRLLRGNLTEVLGEDYIRTANAKGLATLPVLLRHALQNAAVPIVTVVGIGIALLISGVVITETVFNIPGIGRLVVDAIARRDYPIIQGAMVVFAGIYVLINLLVDLSYGLLDPRIRYQ